MKKNKVIKSSSIETSSPMATTILYVLAMDYWNAPQWLWGAFGLILLAMWVLYFYSFFTEERVDLFKDSNNKTKK